MTTIPHKLVYIEWLDAVSYSTHWQPVEDISREPVIAHSVGWLVEELDNAILLVPHIVDVPEDEQGSGDIVIPKGCIVRTVELAIP